MFKIPFSLAIPFLFLFIFSIQLAQAFTMLRILSPHDIAAMRLSPAAFGDDDPSSEFAHYFVIPKKRAFDRLDVSNFDLAGGFEDSLDGAQTSMVKLKKAGGDWGRRR